VSLRVIQYGLSPIGCGTAKAVIEHPAMELVGVVDIDPNIIGLDVGSILGIPNTGIQVKTTLEQVLAEVQADVALHCTGSNLPAMKGQILELLDAGFTRHFNM
jgi:4-hydroxy-tetrahydrodipicolinate reductase